MNVTLKPWVKKAANSYIEMLEHVDFTYEDEEFRCTDFFEARRRLERMQVNEDYNGDFYRAVFLDGRLVGHVQVVRQDGARSGDGHIGCVLIREACHLGVGTEAVCQMVEAAFRRRKFDRLTAVVYHPNQASARMVEKLGFKLEATLRRTVWKGDGIYYDALVYGLLREDAGIGTSDCCEPEDELTPEELAAIEPTLVVNRLDEWEPLNLERFKQKEGVQLELFEWE